MKYACQYAIVHFLPFVETGEFANVGVVLFCPQKHFFDFKLITRRHKRITYFFHQIDGGIYRDAISFFRVELEKKKKMITQSQFTACGVTAAQGKFAERLFVEITRKREAMLRFDNVRAVLTDNPAQKLDELFSFYVEHDFVKKENKQQELERQIRCTLTNHQLARFYEERVIGNEFYSEKFPFVRGTGAETKVIKPLNF